MSISDKIDHIVTNRVLALPIFAGIMFLMYASKYMDQIDMRTCAREPELWSEDLFKYLTESGFYEKEDLEWEQL